MWEECWVPKIGDFGLAAEAMDEATGDTVLVPTPMSSTPPSPKMGPCSDATTTSNSSLIDQHLKQRPKRPKPKRTRTVGVGTRTVSTCSLYAMIPSTHHATVCIPRTVSHPSTSL